jgi:hypothetical protein
LISIAESFELFIDFPINGLNIVHDFLEFLNGLSILMDVGILPLDGIHQVIHLIVSFVGKFSFLTVCVIVILFGDFVASTG